MTVSEQLGTALAVGNTATVHPWGADSVVKVLLPHTPPAWADLEAEFSARVHADGLPVPAVLDVIEVDGRRAIVFERVGGRTMLEHLCERPRDVVSLAGRFAELQAVFHATDAPAGLPDQRQRLERKAASSGLPHDVRAAARARLAALPSARRLCHGDLHPGNVLVVAERLVVIDWFDVTAGHPVADVARTSLLVRPRRTAAAAPHLVDVPNALLGAFHTAYLDAYVSCSGRSLDMLGDWELPQVVARLSEGVEQDELLGLLALLVDTGTAELAPSASGT